MRRSSPSIAARRAGNIRPCRSLRPAAPARAGSAWDDVRANVFAGRAINDAGDIVQLSAPTRPTDQRAVPVAVEAAFKDGRTIKA